MLTYTGVVPSKLPCGYVPVDMDVSPFNNSKTCKEGVSQTYKGCIINMKHIIGLKNEIVTLDNKVEHVISRLMAPDVRKEVARCFGKMKW